MTALAIGFIVLTVAAYVLLVKFLFDAVGKLSWDDRRKKRWRTTVLISLIGWFAAVAGWSASGMMGRFDLFPLNVIPMLAVPFLSILVFVFLPSTREILGQIPQATLIGLQSFRIVVEFLLWGLFLIQQLPLQMTFEGRNWDVLSGLLAIPVAYLVARKRISNLSVVFYNLAGLALLANIVSIAILSMPTPFRAFMNDPANTIVTVFPFSLLPAFLVPLAYGLHFLSLRKLISSPNK